MLVSKEVLPDFAIFSLFITSLVLHKLVGGVLEHPMCVTSGVLQLVSEE